MEIYINLQALLPYKIRLFENNDILDLQKFKENVKEYEDTTLDK